MYQVQVGMTGGDDLQLPAEEALAVADAAVDTEVVLVVDAKVPAVAAVDPACKLQVPKAQEVCDPHGDHPTYKGDILTE